MFLVPLLAVGILVLIALGGRPQRFADYPLRLTWLAAAAAVCQFLVAPNIASDVPALVVEILSMAMFVTFLVANRTYPGLVLAGVGGGANVAVMSANDGVMPVGPDAWDRFLASPMPSWWGQPGMGPGAEPTVWGEPGTPLWILSDILALPILPLSSVFSFGDVLLLVGALWCAWQIMSMPAPAAESPEARLDARMAAILQERLLMQAPAALPAPPPLPPQRQLRAVSADAGGSELSMVEGSEPPRPAWMDGDSLAA